MLNCLFKDGKRICSLDLKNEYGEYIIPDLLKIKEAGETKLLLCEECGHPVFLKAGNLKTPHFAHYQGERLNCYYDQESHKESEEHMKGKQMLYSYFKLKYHDRVSDIQVNYRHSNGIRSDIYIEFNSGNKLIVEYQRKDLKISEWRKRHQYYQSINIHDIWILSFKEHSKSYSNQAKRLNYLEELLLFESGDETIKLLNTDNQTIILSKKIEYKNINGYVKKRRFFTKEYLLNSILINPNGNLKCDFIEEYQREKDELDKAIREKEEKQLARKNRLNQELLNTGYMAGEKTIELLESEALAYRQENPKGPWYDSLHDEKWGICKECGDFTKDWNYFNRIDNSCTCRKCSRKDR